jgi:hypothetical protein
MNQKTSRLLLYLCLLGGTVLHGQSAGAATLRETLTQALQNYCVPKDAEGCRIMQPRYQNSSCYCGDPIYMYYDATARTCRVKCPAGQIARTASVCPTAGYGGKLVKNF